MKSTISKSLLRSRHQTVSVIPVRQLMNKRIYILMIASRYDMLILQDDGREEQIFNSMHRSTFVIRRFSLRYGKEAMNELKPIVMNLFHAEHGQQRGV